MAIRETDKDLYLLVEDKTDRLRVFFTAYRFYLLDQASEL